MKFAEGRDYKLRMNFISLACNKFLCFVPFCTIFSSSARAVQESFFVVAQLPLKDKMVRPLLQTSSHVKGHVYRLSGSLLWLTYL